MDFKRVKIAFEKATFINEYLLNEIKTQTNKETKEALMNQLRILHKKVHNLYEDYEAYESLKQYDNAKKAFIKYELALEKFLIHYYKIVPELVQLRDRMSQISDSDVFALFRKDMIRECEAVRNEKYTIKEIKKAYDRWASRTGNKRLDIKDLEIRCEKTFGDSRGKREYSHIRVFLEEEDVEEFDNENTIKQ